LIEEGLQSIEHRYDAAGSSEEGEKGRRAVIRRPGVSPSSRTANSDVDQTAAPISLNPRSRYFQVSTFNQPSSTATKAPNCVSETIEPRSTAFRKKDKSPIRIHE
jgi:hypothetical protein